MTVVLFVPFPFFPFVYYASTKRNERGEQERSKSKHIKKINNHASLRRLATLKLLLKIGYRMRCSQHETNRIPAEFQLKLSTSNRLFLCARCPHWCCKVVSRLACVAYTGPHTHTHAHSLLQPARDALCIRSVWRTRALARAAPGKQSAQHAVAAAAEAPPGSATQLPAKVQEAARRSLSLWQDAKLLEQQQPQQQLAGSTGEPKDGSSVGSLGVCFWLAFGHKNASTKKYYNYDITGSKNKVHFASQNSPSLHCAL